MVNKWAWGVSIVSTAPATYKHQDPKPQVKLSHRSILSSQHRRGRDGWIPGACWPTSVTEQTRGLISVSRNKVESYQGRYQYQYFLLTCIYPPPHRHRYVNKPTQTHTNIWSSHVPPIHTWAQTGAQTRTNTYVNHTHA